MPEKLVEPVPSGKISSVRIPGFGLKMNERKINEWTMVYINKKQLNPEIEYYPILDQTINPTSLTEHLH